MKGYTPPYSITDEMLISVSEIMELLGQLNNVDDLSKLPRLRRSNRIKSIQSSLAIEHNSLSIKQVSDILDDKRVIGPPDEIQEVKNAIDAYKLLPELDPYNMKDLLKAHAVMTKGLIGESGKFRKGGEGVFSGDVCVHLAPPAENVSGLMNDLFKWLKGSKTHPLIKSSVFHYEFEFIHPFSDGNGRLGRFWQTLILSKWKPIFAWIPVESIIINRQSEYYNAISKSTLEGNSNEFIMFILSAFSEAVQILISDTADHINHLDQRVRRLLEVMQDYPMTAAELMQSLGIKSRDTIRNNYLKPALEAGLIEMTEPQNPNSRNQRYFKKL